MSSLGKVGAAWLLREFCFDSVAWGEAKASNMKLEKGRTRKEARACI